MGLSIVSEDGKVHLWTGSYTSFDVFRSFVHNENVTPAHQGYSAFFMHSDADGFWSPEECADIDNLLKSVFQDHLSDDDFLCEHFYLLRFLEGLSYCKMHKQNALFL